MVCSKEVRFYLFVASVFHRHEAAFVCVAGDAVAAGIVFFTRAVVAVILRVCMTNFANAVVQRRAVNEIRFVIEVHSVAVPHRILVADEIVRVLRLLIVRTVTHPARD